MAQVRKPAIAGSKKILPLKKIRLDGDTQSRNELDQNVIREYADLMKSGREFPPVCVVFDGTDYWLWDGFHRRWAAVQSKIAKLKCVVTKGTREDARWLSYGANQDHGLPRTNEDKRKAVVAALKHPNGAKMSDRQIADHVGVNHATVGRYRSQLVSTVEMQQSPTRTGRDGRTINTANIGRKPAKPHKIEVVDEPDEDEEIDEPESQSAELLRDAALRQRASELIDELEGILSALGIKREREVNAIRSAVESTN